MSTITTSRSFKPHFFPFWKKNCSWCSMTSTNVASMTQHGNSACVIVLCHTDAHNVSLINYEIRGVVKKKWPPMKCGTFLSFTKTGQKLRVSAHSFSFGSWWIKVMIINYRLRVWNAFVTTSMKTQDGGFRPYLHQTCVIIC